MGSGAPAIDDIVLNLIHSYIYEYWYIQIGIRCDVLPEILHASSTLTLPAAPDFEDKVVYDCDQGYEVNIVDGLNADLRALYEFTSTSFMVECLRTGRWSSWPMPYCARKYEMLYQPVFTADYHKSHFNAC